MKHKLAVVMRILRAAVTIFLVIAVCIAGYLAIARLVFHHPHPTIFGWSTAVVISGSMEDSVHVNDMVVIHAQESYEVQDVITFYSDADTIVTHRLIAITDAGYQTQGDANDTPDPDLVLPEQVVGKVVRVIPNAGAFIAFFSSPLGMLLLFAIGLLLIFLPAKQTQDS